LATSVALVLTLLAVNAVWGLTSEDDTLISGWLRTLGPLWAWIVLALVFSALVIVVGRVRANHTLVVLGAMTGAYTLAVIASEYVHAWLQPRSGVPFERQTDLFVFLWERSFMLWPAVPMWAVYWWLLRADSRSSLATGYWTSKATSSADKKSKRVWLGVFAAYIAFVFVPAMYAMQAGVEFAPIRQGTLFAFIVPVVGAALFNAFTEEVIFRGLFQPALCACSGLHVGILLQATFFGFHHWGASPDPIAELPTAIATCGLGLLWGYSVVATRGLAWAVVSHMFADIVLFSAYFVPVD